MAVTIQQASANAFATWLQGKMTDVSVEPRWPAPDKKRPAASITVVTAGRRIDTPIDTRLLSATNNGAKQTNATWQVAACRQPFQLDVWADADVTRDDILARLDTFLHLDQSVINRNTTPAGNGVLLPVADGWDAFGTIADFEFLEPDLDDTADDAGRALYRATFRGNAYFMLTVTSLTARQISINFALAISDTDPVSALPFPVNPVTP